MPVVDPSYRKSNRERFTYRHKATWGHRRIDLNRSNRLVNSRFVLPEVELRDKSSCVRRVEVNVKTPHEPSSFLKHVCTYVILTTADMLHENREVNVKIPHEPSSFFKRVCTYVILTTADMLHENREVNIKIPHEPSLFLKCARETTGKTSRSNRQ